MLVKFTSSTSGQMIMFAKNARELFEIMNKSCFAQGVFENDALLTALEKLKVAANTGVASAVSHETSDETDKDEEEAGEDEPVSLRQRAQPLIRLMERTWKAGGFILWEAPQAF